jgi:hypothetical protein
MPASKSKLSPQDTNSNSHSWVQDIQKWFKRFHVQKMHMEDRMKQGNKTF